MATPRFALSPVANIELAASKPFDKRRLPLQDAVPFLLPEEFRGFLCPELLRMIDRLLMYPPILGEALYAGLFLELFGRLVLDFFFGAAHENLSKEPAPLNRGCLNTCC